MREGKSLYIAHCSDELLLGLHLMVFMWISFQCLASSVQDENDVSSMPCTDQYHKSLNIRQRQLFFIWQHWLALKGFTDITFTLLIIFIDAMLQWPLSCSTVAEQV